MVDDQDFQLEEKNSKWTFISEAIVIQICYDSCLLLDVAQQKERNVSRRRSKLRIPHLVMRTPTGKVYNWPIGEVNI